MVSDIVDNKKLVRVEDWYKIETNGDLTLNDKIGELNHFKKINLQILESDKGNTNYKELKKFNDINVELTDVSSLIGMNLMDISNRLSKVPPETLKGTNNIRWVVYFKDLDVTVETTKSTNIVQRAEKGRKEKKDVWSE